MNENWISDFTLKKKEGVYTFQYYKIHSTTRCQANIFTCMTLLVSIVLGTDLVSHKPSQDDDGTHTYVL
jgi:hypothetical protein